jgi:uncharacterized protein YceK
MRALSSFFIVVLLSGCGSAQKRPEEKIAPKTAVSNNPAPDAGASMETKQVAAELDAPFSTEIQFSVKSAALSKESRGRLEKILREAKAAGHVEQIEVYAWSDKEYPGEASPQLLPADHALADARAKAIQSFYAHNDAGLKSKINTILMTEKPSGLKASLNLGDTSKKAAFVESGIRTTAKMTTAAAKKSRASVMIRLKI